MKPLLNESKGKITLLEVHEQAPTLFTTRTLQSMMQCYTSESPLHRGMPSFSDSIHSTVSSSFSSTHFFFRFPFFLCQFTPCHSSPCVLTFLFLRENVFVFAHHLIRLCCQHGWINPSGERYLACESQSINISWKIHMLSRTHKDGLCSITLSCTLAWT